MHGAHGAIVWRWQCFPGDRRATPSARAAPSTRAAPAAPSTRVTSVGPHAVVCISNDIRGAVARDIVPALVQGASSSCITWLLGGPRPPVRVCELEDVAMGDTCVRLQAATVRRTKLWYLLVASESCLCVCRQRGAIQSTTAASCTAIPSAELASTCTCTSTSTSSWRLDGHPWRPHSSSSPSSSSSSGSWRWHGWVLWCAA